MPPKRGGGAPAPAPARGGAGFAAANPDDDDDDVVVLAPPPPPAPRPAPAAAQGGGAEPNPQRTRREQFADIARSRAEFFAHGGGIGRAEPTSEDRAAAARAASRAAAAARGGGAAAAQDDDDEVDVVEEEEEESVAASASSSSAAGVRRRGASASGGWVGPFATATELMRNRDAALRAREEDLASDGLRPPRRRTLGPTGEASSSSSSSSSGLHPEDAEEGKGVDSARARGVRPSAYRPVWKPARPLPKYGDAAAAAAVDDDDREEDKEEESPGKGAAAGGRTPKTPAPARRAIAVAGPSGVRLGVPSLAALCIEKLTLYMK
jgi:hypothetical protein